MQQCSICQSQSPDEAKACSNCGALLSEFSDIAVVLRKYIENPRVKAIRVMPYDDACPACARHAGTYTKENIPLLPLEGCSHEHGCRCFYQPFLTEIYP